MAKSQKKKSRSKSKKGISKSKLAMAALLTRRAGLGADIRSIGNSAHGSRDSRRAMAMHANHILKLQRHRAAPGMYAQYYETGDPEVHTHVGSAAFRADDNRLREQDLYKDAFKKDYFFGRGLEVHKTGRKRYMATFGGRCLHSKPESKQVLKTALHLVCGTH